ncbi:GP179 protein, partial [Cettia cetti]|nr:GP179 protein [Cettia cetti]
KALEKGSRDRESICPWESPDMEQPLAKPQTGSSALPKSPSGKSQSLEKAEICPWETQDPKSSDNAEICPWESQDPKSSDKAEICPWESLDTEQPPAKPQTGSSALPKSPSGKSQGLEKAEICPWEVESSSKAEICPWEVAEPQLEKGTGPGKERHPPKEASKALEKG